MTVLRLLLAVVALGAGFAAPPAALAQPAGVLRVSAIPDEAPTELQRKFKPLGDYLKSETGLDVQFVPVTDYAAVVEGLATNKLDLAWLGGFTYVQARLRTNGGVVPIVQRAEDAKFTSRFIVPTNSTAKTLADLKGKTFAFGAPSSTSGSLMPRYYLLQAGIDPSATSSRSRSRARTTRPSPSSPPAGRGGRAQRVGARQADREQERERGEGPRAGDHAALLRLQLDGAPRPRPAVTKKLTDAFLKLDPAKPAMKEIMDLQRASKFIRRRTRTTTASRPRRARRARQVADACARSTSSARRGRAPETPRDERPPARRRRLVHPNGQRALRNVSLGVDGGERVAVIGPSGRGKTTLVRVLGTSLRPSEGRLFVGDADPWRAGAARCGACARASASSTRARRFPPRLRVVTAVLAGRLGSWPTVEGDRLARRPRRCRRRAQRARPARPRRPRLRSLRSPLRRPAAARRHRPRAVPAAGVHPRRRAGVGARSQPSPT
jgi:phosphonate transport system substrate-binding protein